MGQFSLYNQLENSIYNDTQLSKKTFSFRLPVHVAARLAAISDLFPDQSRSEIIIGILKEGLQQFEATLPDASRPATESEKEDVLEEVGAKDGNVQIFNGPKTMYLEFANKHFVELEKERGNPNPRRPFVRK